MRRMKFPENELRHNLAMVLIFHESRQILATTARDPVTCTLNAMEHPLSMTVATECVSAGVTDLARHRTRRIEICTAMARNALDLHWLLIGEFNHGTSALFGKALARPGRRQRLDPIKEQLTVTRQREVHNANLIFTFGMRFLDGILHHRFSACLRVVRLGQSALATRVPLVLS